MGISRKQPLGIELARRGVVTSNDIEAALKYQAENPSKKIGDILYILKIGDSAKIIEEIGDILGEKVYLLQKILLK